MFELIFVQHSFPQHQDCFGGIKTNIQLADTFRAQIDLGAPLLLFKLDLSSIYYKLIWMKNLDLYKQYRPNHQPFQMFTCSKQIATTE